MNPQAGTGRLHTDFRFERLELSVAELERSRAYYRTVIGLEEIASGTPPAGTAAVLDLGAGGRTLLRLIAVPGLAPSPHRASGLYHVAFLLPDRPALSHFAHHLADGKHPVVGASDHAVSEAIYLEDPDGHGIEVYRDRPEAEWPYEDGELAMRTDPLDVPDLLSALPPDVAPHSWAAPEGTTIGHVHLRVRDVEEARTFYRDLVGFDETTTYPGAAFLSVGGYHHHLGVNAWESAGRGAPDDDVAHLLAVRGSVEDRAVVAALVGRLGDTAERDSHAVTFHDPSGTRWIVSKR